MNPQTTQFPTSSINISLFIFFSALQAKFNCDFFHLIHRMNFTCYKRAYHEHEKQATTQFTGVWPWRSTWFAHFLISHLQLSSLYIAIGKMQSFNFFFVIFCGKLCMLIPNRINNIFFLCVYTDYVKYFRNRHAI